MERNQDGILFAEYRSYNEFEANDFEQDASAGRAIPQCDTGILHVE